MANTRETDPVDSVIREYAVDSHAVSGVFMIDTLLVNGFIGTTNCARSSIEYLVIDNRTRVIILRETKKKKKKFKIFLVHFIQIAISREEFKLKCRIILNEFF